jgi:predicted O-methyltransferase YrrM
METITKEFHQDELGQFNFLAEFAAKNKPKTILEIGSGWGLSACSFLLNCDATIVTIDPRQDLPDFDRRVKIAGVEKRITRIVGRSGKNCDSPRHKSEKFNILEGMSEKFELVYIDGSHDYEHVFYDLTHALRLSSRHILMDDYFHKENYGGSYGVSKALSQIAKDKKFSYIVHPFAHGMVEISVCKTT